MKKGITAIALAGATLLSAAPAHARTWVLWGTDLDGNTKRLTVSKIWRAIAPYDSKAECLGAMKQHVTRFVWNGYTKESETPTQVWLAKPVNDGHAIQEVVACWPAGYTPRRL